jgi:hypothetical protein
MNRPTSLLLAGVALLATGAFASASAATLYVFPNGAGPYPTIQAAIDAAAPGDVIALADGTFTGPGNWDLQSTVHYQGYLIRSVSGDPLTCVIDLQHHPLATWDYAGLEFRGIGMRNGTGVSLANVTLILTQCRLEGWSGSMTGLWDFYGIRFEDCQITGCPDFVISAPTLELYRCSFIDNPGLGLGSWFVTVSGCELIGNAARPGGSLIQAMAWMSMPAQVGLNNCRFEGNRAPYLVDVGQGDLNATGCVFVGNAAAVCHVMPGLSASTAATFESCTIAAQSPVDAGQLVYAEVWEPSGYYTVTVALDHTIVAFNAAPPTLCDPLEDPDVQFTAECSDIFGNTGGDWVGCLEGLGGVDDNLSLDPLFCDLPYGGCELRDDSPCAPAPPCDLIGALPVGCSPAGVAAGPAGGPRLTAQPNPATSSVRLRLTGEVGGEVGIAVTDASGRVVRRLVGPAGAGARDIVWDMRGSDGARVPPGIYFARLEGAPRGVRVIVIR